MENICDVQLSHCGRYGTRQKCGKLYGHCHFYKSNEKDLIRLWCRVYKEYCGTLNEVFVALFSRGGGGSRWFVNKKEHLN